MSVERNGKQVSLQVKEDVFKNSIHGMMFGCTDCHTDVKEIPHGSGLAKPSCATCHADQQKAYDNGFHAKAIKGGENQAARCVDCHGGAHEILPSSDANSKTNHKNIPATCATCHNNRLVAEATGLSPKPVMSYQESVHGQAVAAGSEKAAVCTDCHGSHEIRTAGDPQSSIFKTNVPLTCAKCHEAQKTEFMTSIHGQAITKGNLHAPVCTDCHGIHLIKRHIDPTSSVAAQNLARTTCAQCHESVKMSEEFGVPGRRASTYMASYHGMATQMGSAVAANCASCHGVHNILPSSDPRSKINKANLVKTCGECHPGANENFAKGKVHVDAPQAADIGSVAVRLVRQFYLLMIVGTIGGMLLHNLIILRRKLRDRRNGHVHFAGGPRVVVRMTRNQRMQHLALLTSFITLVLTGFALKYPTSWLGLAFGNETVRSVIHRVAGVVLIVAGLYHVFYMFAVKEGRSLVRDFLPTWKDVLDARDAFFYYLGISDKRPQFARFGYAEKVEYWALVWGTIVMAVTGLMLWFKVRVGNLVPRWTLDVATAIHFYEAILATLSILVWHFYQIIFDPDVYPMNWAWLDGKMSLDHYREEHPLDDETLMQYASGQQEEQPAAEHVDDAEKKDEQNKEDSENVRN
ncbi:MAG TPA: cytochrome b/b6 domain-containing protein [Clostridia bacterium]|nr:cytochrome b/b6 domain-containing protein [Clostridia bacterium]